jgi:hypothetical protein
MMAVRRIHFRDRRPPHEIQFALERELMTLLQPSVDGTQLMIAGASTAQGVPFRVSLRLEAAHFFTNCYQLAFEADQEHLTPAPVKGGRKPLDGWVDLWTREFKPINAPEPGEGSADRAQQLAQQALSAESHLTTVEAVQAEILGALRRGASFSTAHKEGGSIIKYQQGHFVRSDYGESDEREVFHNDADFLAYLRRLYDWETSRPIYPQKVPEYVAWKLMLRLLRR